MYVRVLARPTRDSRGSFSSPLSQVRDALFENKILPRVVLAALGDFRGYLDKIYNLGTTSACHSRVTELERE